MVGDKFFVEGELHISLEVIAEVYGVQSAWLHDVYKVGLLGSGVDSKAGICIAAFKFDRVATIVRMHQQLGLDLDAIELHLPEG